MNSRDKLVAHIGQDAGVHLRCAVAYLDRPKGVWAVFHHLFANLFRIRLGFFSFEGLANKVFGITEGYLGLTSDGRVVQINYASEKASVAVLDVRGADLKVGEIEHLLALPRRRTKMRYLSGNFFDAEGNAVRDPELMHDGMAMVSELNHAIQSQSAAG